MEQNSLPTDVVEYLRALNIDNPEILKKVETMGVWSVEALKRATFDEFCHSEQGKSNPSFASFIFYTIHPPAKLTRPITKFLTAAGVDKIHWEHLRRLEGLTIDYMVHITHASLRSVGMGEFLSKIISSKIQKHISKTSSAGGSKGAGGSEGAGGSKGAGGSEGEGGGAGGKGAGGAGVSTDSETKAILQQVVTTLKHLTKTVNHLTKENEKKSKTQSSAKRKLVGHNFYKKYPAKHRKIRRKHQQKKKFVVFDSAAKLRFGSHDKEWFLTCCEDHMLRRAACGPRDFGHYYYQFLHDGTTYSIKCGLTTILDIISDFTNDKEKKIKKHLKKLRIEKEGKKRAESEEEESEAGEKDRVEESEVGEEEGEEESEEEDVSTVIDSWEMPDHHFMYWTLTDNNDTIVTIASKFKQNVDSFWKVNHQLWKAFFAPSPIWKTTRFMAGTRVPYMSPYKLGPCSD